MERLFLEPDWSAAAAAAAVSLLFGGCWMRRIFGGWREVRCNVWLAKSYVCAKLLINRLRWGGGGGGRRIV